MSDGPWIEKWKREREAENDEGMEEILRHPASRTWLMNLIGYLSDSPTFQNDPRADAYMQGRRSIGLEVRTTAQRVNFETYYRGVCEMQHPAREYLTAKKNDADKVPLPKET